jgi:hypothetical protein
MNTLWVTRDVDCKGGSFELWRKKPTWYKVDKFWVHPQSGARLVGICNSRVVRNVLCPAKLRRGGRKAIWRIKTHVSLERMS